ncbi:hypothetical protein PAXINDRAFT_11234 [Paxillus involutus ATCC 200175]|nr:hypothetical protein PAXINDRAFT_11234 [Paxillus involutus ATCC 200175]
MDLILDEYNHLIAQGGGKSKSKDDDVAFRANTSKKGKRRGEKFMGDCFNCGWKGHTKDNCWEEGGGKAGKVPKSWRSKGKKEALAKDLKGNTNTAAELSNKPDAVWLAAYNMEGLDEPEATSMLPYTMLA